MPCFACVMPLATSGYFVLVAIGGGDNEDEEWFSNYVFTDPLFTLALMVNRIRKLHRRGRRRMIRGGKRTGRISPETGPLLAFFCGSKRKAKERNPSKKIWSKTHFIQDRHHSYHCVPVTRLCRYDLVLPTYSARDYLHTFDYEM